jgi:hypothetical protein
MSHRRHPPPVPPGGELGSPSRDESPFTHGARMIGIRFPVKKNGPTTQDTFDRIDIRRPRAPPSPRELWRRSRTPGSPAREPPPRVNEGSRLPTDQELAPRGCVRPISADQTNTTSTCASIPPRATPFDASRGSTRFHDLLPASVDPILQRPVFPPVRRVGSDLRCPVAGRPVRRPHSDDSRTPDLGRFPPIRVNVTGAPRPRTPRVAREPSSGPPPDVARPSGGVAQRVSPSSSPELSG